MQKDQRTFRTISVELEAVRHELRRRWPSWRAALATLDDQSELFDRDTKTIFIDLRHWPEGPAFAVRHAITHLDWGHLDEPGPFTDEQCDAADDVARLHTQEQAWVM